MDPHLAHFPRQPGLLGPLPRGSPVILPIKCLPLRILALAGAVAVLAPLVAVIQPQRASADEVVPAAVEFADESTEVDGLTEATAAASCWEIKQNDPNAQDGTYWLWTPQLGAPDQFYCDQTTDGGGWVLIGRGREGWSESNMGSGTSAQVRSPATGIEAFSPRQLPSRTIEALIGGESVNSLPDGIRLHRATNQGGTSWQDLSFTLASPRDTWTWQFYNNQRVETWTVDGSTYRGGGTSDFGVDSSFRRVVTTTGSAQGWMYGFGFGNSVSGSPSDASYIWGTSASMRNPRPFTQVYIRPELTSEDARLELPAEGTEATTQGPGAESFAQPTTWGVSGLGNGPQSIEGSNEVSAFAEVDGVVLVGGNFTAVQTSAGGANQQSQSYLAAFDVETGEWISSFRPVFDNQIKALAAMPDGRIAVGGYFSTVNGQSRAGLAVLDAHTGQLDSGFSGRLINYLGSGVPVVRGLDVQDGWLYAAGSFSHSTGGSENREVYTRAAARFSVADGTPDASWNPEFNGTVISADASAQGDRVYFAGYFGQSKTTPTLRAAAIQTSNAEALDWPVQLSTTARHGYQQAVLEVGDRVWLGGSEHSLFSYSRDDFGLLSTVIGQRGGDFQAIASDGTTVYGGCHCFDAMYTGADSWPNVGNSWTAADRIYAAGAWDADTAAFDPEFSPELYTIRGAGAWALFVDSTGTLWEGGDFKSSTRTGYVRQSSGGFVRFAPRDVTAPDKPTSLSGTPVGAKVSLAWDGVGGAAHYEVLNSGRVIASTSQTTITVPFVSEDINFAVRAVDAAGNRSASTQPIKTQLPEEGPQDPVLIDAGSSWSYLFTGAGPDGDWTDPGYDYSSWATGSAPLGWGQQELGTTLLTEESPKPITSYYSRSFDVVDATKVESVQLTTRADDGIIVYVNGTEVLRQNVDEGASGSDEYANAWVGAGAAIANPVVVDVPGNLFVTGTNVITAEVHSNYRGTTSHSFELKAVATFGTQPPPEEPPTPDSSVLIDAGSSWSYSFGGDPVAEEWNQPGTDVSSWPVGAAPLGWGQPQLGTELSTDASPKPIVSYYRSEFVVPAEATGSVEFTTRVDDGIVLYLNGDEVDRVNIDEGSFSANTYANRAVSAASARDNPVVFTVPVAELNAGVNTIAAEVHSNYRNTPSHSFELSAQLVAEGAPLAVPMAPQQDDVDDQAASAPEESDGDESGSEAVSAPEESDGDESGSEAASAPEESDGDESGSEVGQSADSDAADREGQPLHEGTERSADAQPDDPTSGAQGAADETDTDGAVSELTTVLAADTEWSFYNGENPVVDEWMDRETDVTSWSEGAAPFGYATGDQEDQDALGTVLEPEASDAPVTSYFRTTFTAPDGVSEGLTVNLRTAGGAIVYINGVEVQRVNLPDGPLTADTLAQVSENDPTEQLVDFFVPVDALHAGENTVAVAVHVSDSAVDGPTLDLVATTR